jgi:hypothetical protein
MTDIDLKTLTPDTSLPTTGFLFGADSQATANPSVYSTQTVATTLLGSTSLTGDVLTASAPVLNLTQQWNSSGTTFTGLKFNVDTTTYNQSAAASLLMDLQVGGTSQFKFGKDGTITVPNLGGVTGTGNLSFRASSGASIQLFGVDTSNSMFAFQMSGSVFTARSTAQIGFSSGADANGGNDTILTRKAAANLRFGAADAATAVPQLLSVQSVVAGTAGNVAGQNFTITGSQGVGSGAGGSLIFQVAPAGSTATFTVTFTNGSATISGTGLPATAGTAVAFTTTGALPTNFAINTTYFVLAGSTSTAITVAATAGGTAIVAGSAGSGTQTLTQALAQNALAAALTLASDYSAAFVGNLRLADGTSSVASLGFNNGGFYNLGFYKAGSDSIGIISSSGVYARLGNNSNAFFMRSDAFVSWSSNTGYAAADVIILRDDANILAQRNGVNAQAKRVYNTYTDASNYERGVFDFKTTANVLTIGTEKLGTGATRNIQFLVGGVNKLDYGITGSNWTVTGNIQTPNSIQVTFDISLGRYLSLGPNPYTGGSTVTMYSATSGILQLSSGAGIGAGFDRIQFGGTTTSFPALKRSTTSLQARLADDSAFTNIQGKLTTDTNATVGTITPDKYLVLYDATGTAYRVPVVLN